MADCIAELLEFAAFIKLRISHPDLYRPYAIPLDTRGCIILLLPASIFVVLLTAVSSTVTLAVASLAVVFGVVLYPVLRLANRRGWCEFRDVTCCDQETTET